MRIFLSYARADYALVERINAALRASGFDTFIDTRDLPPGEEYNARIKLAMDDADLLFFFVSMDSTRPGSYAMTELSFAEGKWPNPSGHVLPVLLENADPARLPSYIRSINALRIRGNPEAEIVGWVQDRVARGSIGIPGLQTPRERLTRWARLARPPLRKGRRVFLWKGVLGLLFGTLFIIFGLVIMMSMGRFGGGAINRLFPVLPMLMGTVLILYCLWMILQGLRGGRPPVPVVVLDRKTSEKNEITVELETLQGKRLRLYAATRETRNVYTGELGWAYIRGRLLLEFVPASRDG